jgi:hypothetical protein
MMTRQQHTVSCQLSDTARSAVGVIRDVRVCLLQVRRSVESLLYLTTIVCHCLNVATLKTDHAPGGAADGGKEHSYQIMTL